MHKQSSIRRGTAPLGIIEDEDKEYDFSVHTRPKSLHHRDYVNKITNCFAVLFNLNSVQCRQSPLLREREERAEDLSKVPSPGERLERGERHREGTHQDV